MATRVTRPNIISSTRCGRAEPGSAADRCMRSVASRWNKSIALSHTRLSLFVIDNGAARIDPQCSSPANA
jgi:hypothetical protein